MRGLSRRQGAMQPYSGGLQPMFSMLDELRREFDRFFHEAETLLPMPAATVTGSALSAFVPPVDIHETERDYVIAVEVPGIEPKDIDVCLEGQSLIIRGERQQQHDEDIGTMHRSERSFGAFSRAFTLPQDVVTDAINARFRHGVLTITVPKSQAARTKQVQIEAEETAPQIAAGGQTGQPVGVSGMGREEAAATPQAQQRATGGMSNTAQIPQGQTKPGEQMTG